MLTLPMVLFALQLSGVRTRPDLPQGPATVPCKQVATVYISSTLMSPADLVSLLLLLNILLTNLQQRSGVLTLTGAVTAVFQTLRGKSLSYGNHRHGSGTYSINVWFPADQFMFLKGRWLFRGLQNPWSTLRLWETCLCCDARGLLMYMPAFLSCCVRCVSASLLWTL